MVTGALGTSWPAAGEEVTPDVLIVPLAAYSSEGFRLGYGGGFYDRTLERLRAGGEVTAIGFAYSGQEDDAIPVEATDQPLDVIVTERGAIVPPRGRLPEGPGASRAGA
jgi:5-formyltetrahydrofolate cyclo-ligase